MNCRTHNLSRLLVSVLAVVLAAAAVNLAAEEPRGVPQKFGNSAARGTWAFSISGTAFVPDPGSGVPVPVPFSAIGQYEADGKGIFPSAVRTVNFGGQVLHQTAVGTYQVHPDGTGVAEFQVYDRDTGILVSEEAFEFVISADRNQTFAIGTAVTNYLLDPGGLQLATVTQVTARRQWTRE